MDDDPLCSPDDERGCSRFEDEDEKEDEEADKKVDEQPSKKRPKKESPEAWMHDAAAAEDEDHQQILQEDLIATFALDIARSLGSLQLYSTSFEVRLHA